MLRPFPVACAAALLAVAPLGAVPAHAQAAGRDLHVRALAPVRVLAGERVLHEVDVSNNGDVAATGVHLEIALPTTRAPGDLGAPAGCTETPTTLSCPLPDLAPGALSVVTFTVTAGPAGSLLQSTATAVADGADRDVADDADTVRVLVAEPTRRLSVAMAGAATARVGDVVSFTVTVTNRGTATATGVVLSVATAAGEPVVGHVDSDRVFHAPCALADTTLTCDVGVLGVSQTATASLRVGPLVRAGRRTTTARATAAGGQTPTAQAAFMTTVVAPSPAPSAHPTPTTAPPTVAPPTQPPAVRPPTVRPPGGRTTGQPTGTRVKGVKLVRGSDGVVRRLPATGRPTGQLAAFGLALLAAGATFRYAGRRRRS